MKVFKSFVLIIVAFIGINTTIKAENSLTIKPKHQKVRTSSAFRSNTVLVKVVNEAGETVVETEVSVSQFLDKAQKISLLPENSMFLLFYGNTAYYLVQNQ